MAEIEPERAESLAESLFAEFTSLGRIWVQSPEALARVLGKDSRAAHLLYVTRQAILETMQGEIASVVIDARDPTLGRYLVTSMGHLPDEVLRILFLDGARHLIADEQLQWGTLGEVALHPRTIFRRALEHNAAGIILVHNHPSGDPSPSSRDVEITDMLRDIGHSLDVTLVDHIIVTAHAWQSIPALPAISAVRRKVGTRLGDSSTEFDLAAIEWAAHSNAKREQRRRKLRQQVIGMPSLFGEPAWEMLTDLFIHECEGKRVATSSLCIASGAPVTTALRLLNRLSDSGMVRRRRDKKDARRQFVELAPDVRRKMLAYFAAQSMIGSVITEAQEILSDGGAYCEEKTEPVVARSPESQ